MPVAAADAHKRYWGRANATSMWDGEVGDLRFSGPLVGASWNWNSVLFALCGDSCTLSPWLTIYGLNEPS